MKSPLYRLLIVAVLLSGFAITTKAQKNGWKKIGDEGGVTVYWRWKQMYRNTFSSEIKLENSNNYNVEVTIYPVFTCPDGIPYNQGGMVMSVDAKSSKTGEKDGLAFYPCRGEKIPRNGSYEKLKVQKL